MATANLENLAVFKSTFQRQYMKYSYNKFYDLKGTQTLAVHCSINGFHHFRFRPPVGLDITPLKCVREPENEYDFNAIKVVVPELAEFDTDERDDVHHIVGKTVGRVPKILARLFSPLIDNDSITNITSCFTGQLEHGKKVYGNGPKLRCWYFIEIHEENIAKLKIDIMDIPGARIDKLL